MPRVVHFEIQADDPQRAAAFYVKALGWNVSTWGGTQAYWLAETGPESDLGINGAIMERSHPTTGVINTVGVASLDATLADIEAAGGRRVSGPNDIPSIGRHAYCADTEGNIFGVLEPIMDENERAPAPRRKKATTGGAKRATAKKRRPAGRARQTAKKRPSARQGTKPRRRR